MGDTKGKRAGHVKALPEKKGGIFPGKGHIYINGKNYEGTPESRKETQGTI